MIAFAYYGAKNGLLSELLPLLPAADHYCEPFSGSATELYSAGTWQKIRFKSRKVPMSRGAGLIRQECLWVNYNPYPTGSGIQTTIFHDESFTK